MKSASELLIEYAAKIFNSHLYALVWFDAPVVQLGSTPSHLLRTPEGRERLFIHLAQIEAGLIPHHRVRKVVTT